MKTVFTNSEITHIYASRSQATGRSNSMHFDGDTFYSYSQPIGQFVDDGRAILLNRERFSVTTSAHQSALWSDVSQYNRIEVGFIKSREGAYLGNHAWYETSISDVLKKASRAKKDHMIRWYLGRAQSLIDSMTEYVRIFSLDWTVPVIPDDLKAIRDAARKEAAEESAATRKRKAERAAEDAERIQRWLSGENTNLYGYDGPTVLRVNGDEIQTSRDARFPIAHARAGLALVKRVMAGGSDWSPNGHSLHLGLYTVNRIEKNGTVHAGCHVVPWSSIERIAPQLEDSPFRKHIPECGFLKSGKDQTPCTCGVYAGE